MNGRVYDYNLGRFLSVDPFVHEGSQGINPYSYLMNNPLAGTDPTGYTPRKKNVDRYERGDGGCARGKGKCWDWEMPDFLKGFNQRNNRESSDSQQSSTSSQETTEIGSQGKLSTKSSIKENQNANGQVVKQTDGTVYEPNKSDGITAVDDDGVPTFDANDGDFHAYNMVNSCEKSSKGCNIDLIRQGSTRFPAPGASGEPVVDEQVGVAKGLGLVRHEVSADGSVIINVTLAGTTTTYDPILQIRVTRRRHLLAPGRVIRTVTQDKNRVYINTYGDGTGFAGALNNALKHQVWDPVDQQVFDWASQQ